jgi:alkanesulfonate monooxygenase SsuD/methylene tetrahydromethanopterin reductase-like flavin-dependent oxidoreductase (luciferase family)
LASWRGLEIPIFIAALSPAMLRLAGEIGDGVMLRLCNPSYVLDVVAPAVRTGRERAGKAMAGFEIVAAVPAALTDEPPAHMTRSVASS